MAALRGGLSEQTCRRLTLLATVLGSSMAYVTAINVAVPAIGADLEIDLGGQQWIVLSYSLAPPPCIRLPGARHRLAGSEHVHSRHRWLLLQRLPWAESPPSAVLPVARLLQGAAGALLTTGSLSLLRTTFGEASGRAIGIWTAGTGARSSLAHRSGERSLSGPRGGGFSSQRPSCRRRGRLRLARPRSRQPGSTPPRGSTSSGLRSSRSRSDSSLTGSCRPVSKASPPLSGRLV